MELQALQRLAAFSELAGASWRSSRDRRQVMELCPRGGCGGQCPGAGTSGHQDIATHHPFPLRGGTEPSC